MNVSEIVYETKNQEDLKSKYETIINKINEIGLKNQLLYLVFQI